MPVLHVTQLADGPGAPVVLGHALGLDHGMWQAWAASQAGRRPVLAFDQRGHGRSPPPGGPLTMASLAEDAAMVVREWCRGPVAWIGLSMGAMVGQGLAILHPELVRGLVLANTTAAYPEAGKSAWAQRIEAVRRGGMEAVADLVVQRYLHDDYRSAHPAEAARLRDRILANDPASYIAACQAVAGVNWLDRLPRIACPTLVIAGARDAGATPGMAAAIASRIPGAALEILADASHLSVAEQPEAFAQLVGAFLAGIDRDLEGP